MSVFISDSKIMQSITLNHEANIQVNKSILRLLGIDGFPCEELTIDVNNKRIEIRMSAHAPIDGVEVVRHFDEAMKRAEAIAA